MLAASGRHTIMSAAIRRVAIDGSTTGVAMPTNLGSVRRRLLTPQLKEVTFAERGFPAPPSAITRKLEAIPEAVICGFEWGIDSRSQWEVERRLDLVDDEQRGFAYDGGKMGVTVLG